MFFYGFTEHQKVDGYSSRHNKRTYAESFWSSRCAVQPHPTVFLDVNDDVGFLQFFMEMLILPAQLLVFGGQRIPLRLRTSLLRKGFVYGAIALFTPAVEVDE